ncbi:MAG: hypothetical protein ABJK20_06640 [Halieaceae bacterium]
MKTVKILGGVLAGLIVVIALIAYFLLGNLDGIIKGVIEDVGTEVTGTRVTVDAVELELSSGKGRITGLTIDNPPGYDSDYAFKLNDITVGIQPASVTKPVIVISEVTIRGASLIAEQKGERTNLSDLLDNIEKSSKTTDSEVVEEKPEQAAGDVRLYMKKFVFAGTKAKIITETNGEAALKVPNVTRQNIGDPSTGLTPEQMAEQILQAVVEEVENAVAAYLADLAKQAVERKVREKIGLDGGDESSESGLKSLFKRGD